MSANDNRNLEEQLELFLRGEIDVNTDSPPELRAAKWLLRTRRRPDPAFVEELEDHLREYAASSFHRPLRQQKERRGCLPRLWFADDDEGCWFSSLLRLATALMAIVLLVSVVATVSPLGQAAAREVGHFLGITSRPHPTALQFNPDASNLPVPIADIQAEVGFRIRFPTYVPDGLKFGQIKKISSIYGTSSVQLTYATGGEPDIEIVSIRESRPPDSVTVLQLKGERIEIHGNPGVLSKTEGPISLTIVQWVSEDIFFEIASRLPDSETLKVAHSLR